MFTGTLPFRGDTSAALFNSILNKIPPSALRSNPDLPAELDRIINYVTQKKERVLSSPQSPELELEGVTADQAQKTMETQLGKGGGNIPFFIPFLEAMVGPAFNAGDVSPSGAASE